ncbi:MAG: type II toxin-antitoxin system MqsA family antitoxin [Phycisphaerae bacterium]
MKCVICKKGETQDGLTTVTLEREGLTLVVKGVPAQICANCGEDYVDEQVAKQLLNLGEELATTGTQVEIRQFVAA